MTIAEALRRFRKDHDLKQQDVADALGIKAQSYRVYEVNVKPSAEIIKRIADAFDVSADYLLGRIDTPKFKSQSQENMDIELVQAAMDLLGKALKHKTTD